MSHRVTIREIAIAAGVSKSTAAYALHNDHRVKPATRKKVLETAKKLSYWRDPSLESLVSYRWPEKKRKSREIVALLTPVPLNPNWSRDTLRTKSLSEAGEFLGFTVATFAFSEYASPASLNRVLRARGINTLLLGAELKAPSTYEGFQWDSFYMVEIGRGVGKQYVHSVHTGISDSIELAVQKCLDSGFSRIGVSLIRHTDEDYGLNRRMATFHYLIQQRLGSDKLIPVHTWSPIWTRTDTINFRKWLHQYNPEVVIGLNGTVLYELEAESIKVPDKVKFISLHTNRETGIIAGIDLDFQGHATAALRMLSGLRSMGEMGFPAQPERVVLPPLWIPGTSFPEA